MSTLRRADYDLDNYWGIDRVVADRIYRTHRGRLDSRLAHYRPGRFYLEYDHRSTRRIALAKLAAGSM